MPLITGTQSLLLAHNKQREKYQLGKNDSCARSAGMEVSHAIRLVGVSPENDMTEKCIFQDEKYQTVVQGCAVLRHPRLQERTTLGSWPHLPKALLGSTRCY